MAVGAKVEIKTFPGYMPLRNDPTLKQVFRANCVALFGEDEYPEAGHRSDSTDMGDICHLMPTLHPYVGGGRWGRLITALVSAL